MYLNANQLPPETTLRDFDVCIIGAGAAGIAIAQRLLNTSVRVLLLTNGQPGDKGLPSEKRQSIYKGTAGDFLQKVDPIFHERSRLNMYGGTTNHFGFWARPLDEMDYKPRPGYRDAHWAIEPDELDPYYADANHFGNFGPYNYDDMPFWEDALYARNFDAQEDDALTGAIMHAQYEEDIHDFQVQFGEQLKHSYNITVLFNAHVLEIESPDAREHVTRLKCATIENEARGRDFSVEATNYVLAVGGIEVVRLLKLSGEPGNNVNDMLGRGFMVHPLLTNAARLEFETPVPREIRNFFRSQLVRLKVPEAEGEPYTQVFAPPVNPELMDDFCIFDAWGVLVPTPEVMAQEKIGNFRIILRFANDGKTAEVNINWEQVTNENSYIGLDSERVDPIFGQPVAYIDWRLRDEDKHTCKRALALTAAYLEKRGGKNFKLFTDLSGGADDWSFAPEYGALETGDHHMGATRMSHNPADGIVNPDCRVHSVDNLYIAGCSVFPTGGFANPTLTIVALALRLADHLKSTTENQQIQLTSL